ncbi:ATP-binding protein [Magnetococcus sp. PR-3]|uniref:ATP-binding protein n=1 Tax=Magnetococcus sp. PR-3 TaxID=3120355 RepID=UPI002FCE342F
MTISGKIITLVSLIAVLAAGSVGYAIMQRFQQELVVHAEEEVTRSALDIAVQLNQTLQHLISDLRTLSKDPALVELAERARGQTRALGDLNYHLDRTAQIFTNLAQERPDYQQIRLIGLEAHGREVIRIERPTGQPHILRIPQEKLQSKGQHPYFKRGIILPKDRVYLSEINLNREHGAIQEPHVPVIRASMPIFDQRGETFGILVINLDVRPLFRLIQAMPQGRSMYLFNSHGYLLAGNATHKGEDLFGFEFNQAPQMLNLYPQLAQRLNHGLKDSFSLISNGAQGYEELVGVVALHHNPDRPDQRLVITVGLPYHEILAQLYNSRNESLVVGLTMVVMALLLAVMLTRSLTRPLREMIHSVHAISRGQVDQPLPTTASGEVGILANAFDEMLKLIAQKSEVEADNRAKQLLEATDVGVFGIDEQGLVSFINPAAERMLGYHQEELLGQNIHDKIHHSYADGTAYPEHACRMSAALREQREHHVTDEVLWNKDGSFFYTEYSSIPLWKGEKRSGAVITFWDITEKRLDEQKLILSQQDAELNAAEERTLEMLLKLTLQESDVANYLEEVLETLIYSVPWLKLKRVGALFLTDDSGPEPCLKLMVNHNLDPELTQRCAEVPFGTCLCGQAAQSGTLQFADCIDHRHEIQFEGIAPHGHYNVPIMDGEQVLGVLVLYLTHGHQQKEDETAFLARAANVVSMGLMRRQAALELSNAIHRAEQANQAKSEFLATMSHEIRNPMNAIIGLSHLAMEQTPDKRQKDYLGKIHHAGQSLLRIINDILDFSKIEAGKLAIEQTDFQLDDVLSNLATLTAVKAQEKQIELIFDKAPGLPNTFRGDPLRLSQILLNLIGNAIKFTDEGEVELCITAHPLPATENITLTFAVRDTGIGMTDAQLSGLFSAYQQAEASTSRRYGGSGLGLSISHQLVTLMAGEISVTSTPNKGSLFQVTLPFSVPEHEQPSPQNFEGSVVIASTNQRVREVVGEHLQRFGLICHPVKDMTALSQWLDQHPLPLLMVVDADMLPVSMAQDLELLLSPMLQRFEHGGVLLLHGYQTQQAVMDLSANDNRVGSVQKPVTPSSLYDSTMQLLGDTQWQGLAQVDVPKGSEPTEHWPQLAGRHLLLAEDNPINQQVASELLRRVGIQVTVVSNGFEAVEKATSGQFDAILMDLQMPIMDGFQATTQIRSRLGEAPLILAMTASSSVEDRQKVKAEGMNDHVGKPIDPEALYQTLSHWLGRSNPEGASAPPQSAKEAEPATEDAATTSSNRAITAEPTSDPYPTLPGINYAMGLQRLGGDEQLYREILLAFEVDQRHTCETLRNLLNTGDYGDLEPIVHTFKGLLGSIGADHLQAMALALETTIQMRQPKDEIHTLIDRMDQEITPLLQALAACPETT